MEPISLSVFSILILGTVFYHAYSSAEYRFYSYGFFYKILLSTSVLLPLTLLATFTDRFFALLPPFSVLALYSLINILRPLPLAYFMLYVDCSLFRNENRIHKLQRPFVMLLIANALFVVLNIFFGFSFTIGANNQLVPHSLFPVQHLFPIFCLPYVYILLLLNRKRIFSRNFGCFLIYPLFLVVGDIIYLFSRDTMMLAYSLVSSILVLFLNIQYSISNTDYLTGLYNRRHFDEYLNSKIKNATDRSTFSAVLFDINDFKSINDLYGHDAGDRALKEAAGILRRTLRYDDFISRLGGDEFVVITDTCDHEALCSIVSRIRKATADFNSSAKRPYKIQFSIGFDIYNLSQNKSPTEFLHHLDNLMYIDKNNSKKSSKIASSRTHKIYRYKASNE